MQQLIGCLFGQGMNNWSYFRWSAWKWSWSMYNAACYRTQYKGCLILLMPLNSNVFWKWSIWDTNVLFSSLQGELLRGRGRKPSDAMEAQTRAEGFTCWYVQRYIWFIWSRLLLVKNEYNSLSSQLLTENGFCYVRLCCAASFSAAWTSRMAVSSKSTHILRRSKTET